MRTVSYLKPGQTLSCVGCHEHRATAPPQKAALAAMREPSKLTPAPEGSWPMRFDRLVQPVLEAKCVRCHKSDADHQLARHFDLTAPRAYNSLINYGKPSLREHVRKSYADGRSMPNDSPAQTSTLLAFLERDGVHKPLLDAASRERFVTWMDVYGQRLGSFSEEQEKRLAEFKVQMSGLIEQNPK
jgi:hypothetical protein